jgi:hypothetical protein
MKGTSDDGDNGQWHILGPPSAPKKLYMRSPNRLLEYPEDTKGVEPVGYRGALLSTLLRATVHAFIQFA